MALDTLHNGLQSSAMSCSTLQCTSEQFTAAHCSAAQCTVLYYGESVVIQCTSVKIVKFNLVQLGVYSGRVKNPEESVTFSALG